MTANTYCIFKTEYNTYIMIMIRTTLFRERRTINLFQEVGSNAKEWGGDVVDRYFKTPHQNDSNFQRGMGAVGAVVSTVTELPDYLIAGIVDKKITSERSNTVRDVRELFKDAVTLRPLKALSDVIRLPGSVTRDAVVFAGGLHGSQNNYDQAA
jgi:hypothetical protein